MTDVQKVQAMYEYFGFPAYDTHVQADLAYWTGVSERVIVCLIRYGRFNPLRAA